MENNQLQVFNNEVFGQVRVISVNEEPWFVAKDISEILEYRDSYTMTRRLDEDEKDTRSMCTLGGNQEMTIINESGLYNAILGSKKSEAKQFKKWITSEVLPSIRKHGAYMTDDTLEKALTSPDFLIQLATKLKDEQTKRLEAERQVVVRDKIIESNKDNIEMAQKLTETNNAYDIGVFSKILSIKNLGRNNFYSYLREKKILMKNNVPYQTYNDYFKVIAIDNAFQSSKTLIKTNGVKYVIKKLIQDEYLEEYFNVEKLIEELEKSI